MSIGSRIIDTDTRPRSPGGFHTVRDTIVLGVDASSVTQSLTGGDSATEGNPSETVRFESSVASNAEHLTRPSVIVAACSAKHRRRGALAIMDRTPPRELEVIDLTDSDAEAYDTPGCRDTVTTAEVTSTAQSEGGPGTAIGKGHPAATESSAVTIRQVIARRRATPAHIPTVGGKGVQWSVVERVAAAFGPPSGDAREHRLRPLTETAPTTSTKRAGYLSPPLIMPAPGTRLLAPAGFMKVTVDCEELSPPHKRQSILAGGQKM